MSAKSNGATRVDVDRLAEAIENINNLISAWANGSDEFQNFGKQLCAEDLFEGGMDGRSLHEEVAHSVSQVNKMFEANLGKLLTFVQAMNKLAETVGCEVKVSTSVVEDLKKAIARKSQAIENAQ